MRFQSAVVALAASFTLGVAMDVSIIQPCAIPCMAAAATDSNCSITDTSCLCKTIQPKTDTSLQECVSSKCSDVSPDKVFDEVAKFCASSEGTNTTASSVSAHPSKTNSTASAKPSSGASGTFAGVGAVALGIAAVLGL